MPEDTTCWRLEQTQTPACPDSLELDSQGQSLENRICNQVILIIWQVAELQLTEAPRPSRVWFWRTWEKLESDFPSLGPALPSQGLRVSAVIQWLCSSQAASGILGAGRRQKEVEPRGLRLGEVLWDTLVLAQTTKPPLWAIQPRACQYCIGEKRNLGGLFRDSPSVPPGSKLHPGVPQEGE